MEIVLLRHGRPDVVCKDKLGAAELQQWIDGYNRAGLAADDTPPLSTIDRALQCNVVVCSNLQRSVQSANALAIDRVLAAESLFRELDLPTANWGFLRLSPKTWIMLLRLMWFAGYSNNSESVKMAKQRVKTGTTRLKQIAEEYGSVLLIGHGMLNRFIARELLSSGWRGPRHPGKRHWEFGVYQL